MTPTKIAVLKILGLGLVFALIFHFLGSFFSGGKVDENNSNFKPISNDKQQIIGSAGVAITTSIGTRLNQIKDTPATLYQDVFDISYIISNKQIVKDKLITTNMRAVNEYLNVLKTDIVGMLNSATDRASTLDFFIDQLKYRHNSSVDNMKTLSRQAEVLKSEMGKANSNIEGIKQKIEKDFDNFDSGATLTNIENYLIEREAYTYAYTYQIFINKFLNQYSYLNNYTKKLVNTLEVNREALIKNVTVVLPSTGDDFMKQLDLLKKQS